MKTFACFVVSVLSTTCLIASAPVPGWPAEVAGPPVTLSEVMRSSASVRPTGAVVGNGFSNQIFVPVVINAAGLNGTFFSTDYFLTNGRNTSQEFLVFLLAAGVSNASAPGTRFTASANATYLIVDYLGAGTGKLNRTGVFTLLIITVISGTNTVDSGGMFYGAARISTPQPACPGTDSFTEPALGMRTIHGDFQAIAIGARQNANFRSNFLFVNFDFNPRAFTVIFITSSSSTSQTVTIAAFSMQELAVPSTVNGGDNGYFQMVFFPVDNADFAWYAAALSADNLSGDAWFSGANFLPTQVVEY